MVDFQSRDTTRGMDEDEPEGYSGGDDGHEHGDEHGADHGHGDRDDHEHGNGDDHEHGNGDDHGHGHEDDHGHSHDHGHDHDHHAHDVESAGVAVVTISTSRTLEDDPAGDAIVAALEDAGHEVASRELIPDDYDDVQGTVDRLAARDDVDVVVTTGGTGVSPDDVTVEAVEPLLDKRLPGFGELFRRLSYEEVGTRVVGTRATAGVVDGVAVFCLPGSENAATLGASEIIAPEAGHLAGLARRGLDEEE